MQATGILIFKENKEIFLASVYQPPHKRILRSDLDLLTTFKDSFIIGGDMNAKNIIWNSRITTSRGKILEHHADLLNYFITGPETPPSFQILLVIIRMF